MTISIARTPSGRRPWMKWTPLPVRARLGQSRRRYTAHESAKHESPSDAFDFLRHVSLTVLLESQLSRFASVPGES
jgi:hypothetical protein